MINLLPNVPNVLLMMKTMQARACKHENKMETVIKTKEGTNDKTSLVWNVT